MAEPHWAGIPGLTDSEKELIEAKRLADEKGKILSLVKEDSKDLPRGNMGLKGIWALIGNSSAMVLLAVTLFWTMYQVSGMHHEGIQTLERLYRAERETQGAIMEQFRKSVDGNTAAVRDLADEVKWLRKTNGK